MGDAMKKVLVLGVGAQGSTVARRLDQHPNVEKIICADYDAKAAAEVAKTMAKAEATTVDASDRSDIVRLAKGCDLLVNALPLEYAENVLEAAIEANCNYQDFAAGSLYQDIEDPLEGVKHWVRSIKEMYDDYGPRFAANGKLAIIGTGSAPGFMCVVARRAVRELDTCDSIYINLYEGLEAERFLPYWWSPVTALGDMASYGVSYENGEFHYNEGFSNPIRRKYREMDREVMLVEHAHDEPVYMGYNADTLFKGAKNCFFKYGGYGIDFAYPLKRAGLLSHFEEEINGRKVIPFDVILAHIPPAPKYDEEIQEILDEGIVKDEGFNVAELHGQKGGKNVRVEAHVSSLDIFEAFERFKLTAEMYFTGQGGYLFSKLFVEDKYDQVGLISSDMLSEENVDYYLKSAEDFDITVDVQVFDE